MKVLWRFWGGEIIYGHYEGQRTFFVADSLLYNLNDV